jgi:hypothetical protein
LIKAENMLTKRTKIRKFMKEKAKMMRTSVEQQKSEQMNTIQKVRCNLSKLNEFVQLRN